MKKATKNYFYRLVNQGKVDKAFSLLKKHVSECSLSFDEFEKAVDLYLTYKDDFLNFFKIAKKKYRTSIFDFTQLFEDYLFIKPKEYKSFLPLLKLFICLNPEYFKDYKQFIIFVNKRKKNLTFLKRYIILNNNNNN